MIRLAYLTTSRSDYGPSYWLLNDLFGDSRFDLKLIVSGSHLCKTRGATVEEIERDGWPIYARIPFLEPASDSVSMGIGVGQALSRLTECFSSIRPDLLLLYGDRYELGAAALAAALTGTPIGHLCGGDITEGAIDNQVRFAVTMMAHLHFPCTPLSAQRLYQVGEEPWRVNLVGDVALDHFSRGDFATKDELTAFLGFAPGAETLLVTFHPTTTESDQIDYQVEELCQALQAYEGSLVVTAPAPDPGSDVIWERLKRMASGRKSCVLVDSLGSFRYRGLLQLVGGMLGNSSSALIEAASVPLPAVNVGSRQQGRERGPNLIDVQPERNAISKGIACILDREFRAQLKSSDSPYWQAGTNAKKIIEVLFDLPERRKLLQKKFCKYGVNLDSAR